MVNILLLILNSIINNFKLIVVFLINYRYLSEQGFNLISNSGKLNDISSLIKRAIDVSLIIIIL